MTIPVQTQTLQESGIRLFALKLGSQSISGPPLPGLGHQQTHGKSWGEIGRIVDEVGEDPHAAQAPRTSVRVDATSQTWPVAAARNA